MDLIIPTVRYLLAFLGIGVLIATLYVVATETIYKKITGHGVSEKVSTTGTIIMLLWLFLSFGSPYPILKYGFKYKPPFITEQDLPASSENRVDRLTNEAQRIQRSLSNIDNLTIGEIQKELSNTLQFIQVMKSEAENQENIIKELKQQSVQEKKNADELKAVAEKVSSLSMDQIEAIKYIVTEDAKNESKKGFWLGVLVSFPIGVVASISASLFLTRLRRFTKAIKTNSADAKNSAAD